MMEINQIEKQIPQKPTTELEDRFYPLLNLPFLEMEGHKVERYFPAEGDNPPFVLTYNGETYDLDSYLESREYWSTEGYTDDLGNQYLYPEYTNLNENGTPIPEIPDYTYITGGWATYQHRVERAYLPLTITKLDGDILELPGLNPNTNAVEKAWCTERDLVQMLRETYPLDEDLGSHFKLVLLEGLEELQHLNFNFLDYDKWKLLVDGDIPLELMLVYLDEEETHQVQNILDRKATPLQFRQEEKPDEVLTLEGWAELPPFERNWINVQERLQQKYPELQQSTFLLQIYLPSLTDPTQLSREFVNRMRPTTRQRILEAQTPLEVSLSMK